MFSAEVEFKGKQAGGRIYRPCFRENKPVFSDLKRAFWACFPENWVYKFGHGKNLGFTRTFLWMLSEKKDLVQDFRAQSLPEDSYRAGLFRN
jgi:hypothetical protein